MLESLRHPNSTQCIAVSAIPVTMMEYECFDVIPYGLDNQTSNLLEFEGDSYLKNSAKEAKMLESLHHPKSTQFIAISAKPVAMMEYKCFDFISYGLDHIQCVRVFSCP